ncbi:hypothetical protein EUTSA_v10029084mg [Eutrema salsugineum]|uniref:Suppressor of forked domain-containing protein n=1 Tax=Eutrema salsugineum TaxID=72664 RepID=V4L855_EUTSA|nr:hypothetical protein EUTSA_v10029084mg [Eutrema salsugineum]
MAVNNDNATKQIFSCCFSTCLQVSSLWHIKSGSMDAAIKIFQRGLKVVPDSEMLTYAYAELEESRGAIQSAKKLYESVLGVSTNSLAHIQARTSKVQNLGLLRLA